VSFIIGYKAYLHKNADELLFIYMKKSASQFNSWHYNHLSPDTFDIESGVKSYNSLDGYEDRIKKYGIYAIGVKIK
jgi:hypothetical protein